MHDFTPIYRQIIQKIAQAQFPLIIAHKKPDGDALGSLCSMKLIFDKIGKPAKMACLDEPPKNLLFLKKADQIEKNFTSSEHDLVITVDCGADYMTGYLESHPEIFQQPEKIINIDHHPSNNNFGGINLINVNAASTSMIINDFIKFANIAISPDLATALLTGIYTDTGSFMHSNTSSEVYRAASELLACGAKLSLIVKNAFKTTPVRTLKLWGKVLSNLKVNDEGVTMAVATQEDFEETGTQSEELSGIIDLLNSLPEAKFSVLLNEDGKGNVKGSFRTQSDAINLSEIAGVFGGGGHKKAAGFTIPGKLEKEVRWKIVDEKNSTIA